MPLTRSKVKQGPQHPSTSSGVCIHENAVALGGKGGRGPKIGLSIEEKDNPLLKNVIDKNVVALGQKAGRGPKIGLGFEEDNPLLNNVVLTVLFEYVKGKDLKVCRMVCKQWNTASLPFARSQLQVRIHGPGQSKTRRIEHFMKLIGSNSLGNPFARFSLGDIDMTTGLGLHFLQSCGTSAKGIVLHGYGQHRIENVAQILKLATKLESLTLPCQYLSSKDDQVVQLFSGPENKKPKFPALNYLNVGWSDGTEQNVCPTFYEEIFRGAENISTLDLGSGTSSVCLEVLETIEKLGRESLIADLTISGVKEQHLVILRRMALKTKGLKLKKLDLKDDGENVEFVGFELFQIFKKSLIALRFTTSRAFDQNSKVITFPHMPNMKILHFKSVHGPELSCENFGNIFPSLERLDLDFFYSYYTERPFVHGNEPCPTYKSSILRLECGEMQIENLNQILTLFPTLRFLECVIPHDDGVEVIRKIWTHMVQLEGLYISGTLKTSQNLDSLVTGIRVQASKELKDFFNSLPKLKTAKRELKIQNQLTMLTKDSELPSIRKLTNLKYLALQLTGREKRTPVRKNYLTLVTAYFGLYSLKNLRHLEMSDCEFSKSCSEILVKDKSLINWEFSSPTDREIIPIVLNYKTVPFYAEYF